MLRRLVLVALLMVIAAPGLSLAAGLQFYDASAGVTNTATYGPASGLGIEIRYDPATADFGGLYAFAGLTFVTTGDLVMDSFVCDPSNVDCFVGVPNTATAKKMDGGDSGGAVETGTGSVVGVFTITGTTGTFEIISGGVYLSATGTTGVIDPFVLATVPEPAALALLGLSLGGLALARYRTASQAPRSRKLRAKGRGTPPHSKARS